MVLEVFGRYAGFTAMLPTMAGAANRCVIPEYKFNIEHLVDIVFSLSSFFPRPTPARSVRSRVLPFQLFSPCTHCFFTPRLGWPSSDFFTMGSVELAAPVPRSAFSVFVVVGCAGTLVATNTPAM
jgi:hypothetical protein